MKRLAYIISVLALSFVLFTLIASAQVGDVGVPLLGDRNAPVIDGNITDGIWDTVPVTLIDGTNCSTSWSYRSLVNGSYEVRFLFSEEGIYIASSITDPTLVLSSGANDVCNEDSGYNHDDDMLGYNGDLFVLALDPFGALESSNEYRNEKGLWYTVTPHTDGSLRVFRSNPDFADVTDAVTGSYIQTDKGWDFELFIPWEKISADTAWFENLPVYSESDFFTPGTRHTASVIYYDRYIYGSFQTVYTPDTDITDYDAQLKTYSYFHPKIGVTYTISRWGTTCDVIPKDNIEGYLGNGVAAKLHGIYLTIGTDHICTMSAEPFVIAASCTKYGEASYRCTECGKVLKYAQRGYSHNPEAERVTVRIPSCRIGIEGVRCSDCGILIYQYSLPAAGAHSDGAKAVPEWVDVKTANGKRILYCTECNANVAPDAETVSVLFTDIEKNSWYSASSCEMYNRGIITGANPRFYRPNDTLTRGMLINALAKLANADLYNPESIPFTDITEDSQYYPAVSWAYKTGITSGTDETHFSPDTELTREQLAVFMMRFAEITKRNTLERSDISAFTDSSTVSEWARDSIEWAVAEKLISGTSKTTLSPKSSATRAQLAVIFCGYIG